jgi:hypothetical protein
MTTEHFDKSAVPSPQLASGQHAQRFRRFSLALTKDVLIAVALLAGIGAVLSIGLSGSDLMTLR